MNGIAVMRCAMSAACCWWRAIEGRMSRISVVTSLSRDFISCRLYKTVGRSLCSEGLPARYLNDSETGRANE